MPKLSLPEAILRCSTLGISVLFIPDGLGNLKVCLQKKDLEASILLGSEIPWSHIKPDTFRDLILEAMPLIEKG